jgi:hypothetical protein
LVERFKKNEIFENGVVKLWFFIIIIIGYMINNSL